MELSFKFNQPHRLPRVAFKGILEGKYHITGSLVAEPMVNVITRYHRVEIKQLSSDLSQVILHGHKGITFEEQKEWREEAARIGGVDTDQIPLPPGPIYTITRLYIPKRLIPEDAGLFLDINYRNQVLKDYLILGVGMKNDDLLTRFDDYLVSKVRLVVHLPYGSFYNSGETNTGEDKEEIETLLFSPDTWYQSHEQFEHDPTRISTLLIDPKQVDMATLTFERLNLELNKTVLQ